jgi:hypothetical protein
METRDAPSDADQEFRRRAELLRHFFVDYARQL